MILSADSFESVRHMLLETWKMWPPIRENKEELMTESDMSSARSSLALFRMANKWRAVSIKQTGGLLRSRNNGFIVMHIPNATLLHACMLDNCTMMPLIPPVLTQHAPAEMWLICERSKGNRVKEILAEGVCWQIPEPQIKVSQVNLSANKIGFCVIAPLPTLPYIRYMICFFFLLCVSKCQAIRHLHLLPWLQRQTFLSAHWAVSLRKNIWWKQNKKSCLKCIHSFPLNLLSWLLAGWIKKCVCSWSVFLIWAINLQVGFFLLLLLFCGYFTWEMPAILCTQRNGIWSEIWWDCLCFVSSAQLSFKAEEYTIRNTRTRLSEFIKRLIHSVLVCLSWMTSRGEKNLLVLCLGEIINAFNLGLSLAAVRALYHTQVSMTLPLYRGAP